MKQKAFLIIFKGPSMKQTTQSKGQGPTLIRNVRILDEVIYLLCKRVETLKLPKQGGF